MEPNAKITVMLVDDHPIVREGLRLVLARSEMIEIVAEAGSSAQALGVLSRQSCYVMLVDISLPDQSGLALLRQINKDFPSTRVVMLSSYEEQDYALTSLRDGACGYVMKTAASEELVTAIRVVASGGKYLSPNMMEKFGRDLMTGQNINPRELLSARERQILQRLAAGQRLTEIANELNLSVKTISTYRSRILEKTGVANNIELVRFAMERGLIPWR